MLIKKLRTLCGTVVFLGIQLLACCHAEIYFFGDSLSEVGNFSIATGGALPPAPLYFRGRFSNGPNWTEYLAKALNETTPIPSLVFGTNYAFNGARAAGASPYGTPDLIKQVDDYLLAHAGEAHADNLFVIWAGANDILFGATSGEANFVAQAIQALTGSIRKLHEAGARNIVVLDLPLLGQTPFFNSVPTVSTALNSATTSFNSLLADQLNNLQHELPSVRIAHVKISQLFQTIVRNPRLFGITNVSDSATLFDPITGLGYALAPNVNPRRYLFWDSVHPTTQGHKIIAAYAFIEIKIHCWHR